MNKAIVLLAFFFIFTPSVMARSYGEGSFGLGNYNEGQPLATSTPSISNSSSTNDNSSTSTSNCSDTAPGKSELFQIDVKGTSVKLFFTPLQSTNRFYISYSTNSNAEEHGTEATLTSDGIQSYTINALKPKSNYYFKIRGQKGCMPGEWSNIVKATSKSNGINKTISYYINTLKTKTSIARASVKLSNTGIKSIPVNEVSTIPKESRQNSVQSVQIDTKKKICLLWWCW